MNSLNASIDYIRNLTELLNRTPLSVGLLYLGESNLNIFDKGTTRYSYWHRLWTVQEMLVSDDILYRDYTKPIESDKMVLSHHA